MIQDYGFKIMDSRLWIQDYGFKILPTFCEFFVNFFNAERGRRRDENALHFAQSFLKTQGILSLRSLCVSRLCVQKN